MKLRFSLINGFLQVIFLLLYSQSIISKNIYINLTIFILLINLSSFITMSVEFKKNMQFLAIFTFFSFISSAITLVVSIFILNYFSLSGPINKLITIGLAEESTINNTIRWGLSYFLFAIFPAYIVVLAGVKNKRRSIIRHTRNKKRKKI